MSELSDARIKAEQLAAEARESSDHWLTTEAAKDATEPQAYRDGYLTARTITAEQVEAAAEALASRDGRLWTVADESDKKQYRDYARAAFEAAGFMVGGGE